jgi:DNA-binding MarR family transcriptional regulator
MFNSEHIGRLQPPPVGLAFLLSQAGAHAAVVFAKKLATLKLTPPDAGILRILGSNPGVTQQTLSDMLGVFPSRLVAFLDELETRHLIERRLSPTDRRIYCLHLTTGGRRALLQIGQVTIELEAQIFAALNEDETERLHALLRRIVTQQQITPGVHPAYRQITKALADGAPKSSRKGGLVTQTFTTRVLKDTVKNATGIVVPPEVVAALGESKKPAVKVTLNGYMYRSTVAKMGGKFMIALTAENRKAAGVAGNDQVEVKLDLDTETRATEIPADLKSALSKAKVLAAFEKAAPSRRKEFVRQVEEAKAAETRQRRIAKIVESLRD